jgi:hypothetical protein
MKKQMSDRSESSKSLVLRREKLALLQGGNNHGVQSYSRSGSSNFCEAENTANQSFG